jgi:flagellar hook-length control protein FliK
VTDRAATKGDATDADAAGDDAEAAGGLKALPKGGDRHVKLARDKAGVDDAATGQERGARTAQRDDAVMPQDLPVAESGRGASAGSGLDPSASFTSDAANGAHDLAALHGAQAAHGSTHTSATTELASATTASAPAPFEAQLSAALGSPEFAPALGIQMSILAKEGVQEARLHLNPADMGPIAVQIAVDGQHARVHFQADLAATRDALQASLPDLANAMKEAGLMLAGGDVSGGRGGSAGGAQADANGRDASGTGGSSTVNAATATTAGHASRPRGVVDVFA